eukprot:GFKZ01011879.1.p1 GENE.GFKZ01011879.1~~GFKZ01011879.1.p1  ORF type:complete len:476 (-),score=28.40 GFKZ01011879.1:471-1898(-)
MAEFCPPQKFSPYFHPQSLELHAPLVSAYWASIILIFLLAAIAHFAHHNLQGHTSTSKSVLSLIFLDSLSYLTLSLSALLLIPATIITRPWHTLTPTFVGPMAAFVTACLACTRMQTYERRMLCLWLRAGSMLTTTTFKLQLAPITAAINSARERPTAGEPSVVALVRPDTRCSIRSAARDKGNARPFFTALNIWWRQGSAMALPSIYILTPRAPFIAKHTRYATHRTVLRALQEAGTRMLQTEPQEPTRMRVVTSFPSASRRSVHGEFGRIWTTVSGHAGVHGRGEAWWYVGAEIVQALKAAIGVRTLSAPGRFDDVRGLWNWVDALGYGWRREFQTQGIARAFAEDFRLDPERIARASVMQCAGLDMDEFNEFEQRTATEVNAVACLGLAVAACVSVLQYRLDALCEAVVQEVAAVDGVWVEDGEQGPIVMGVEEERWPEAELSRRLFRWVGAAAKSIGRAGGPAFEGEASSE